MAIDDKDEKEGKAEEAAPKKGGKKVLFIVGGVLVLILAIGIPVYFFAFKGEAKHEEELAPDAAEAGANALVAEGSGEEDALEEGEEALGAIYPLEAFVVNLEGGRYIRIQAQLEFTGRDVPKRFYTRLVPVRDGIITLLSKKKQDDVLSDKGKENLKKDIKDLVNEVLRKEEVKQVYFTQFVVQ